MKKYSVIFILGCVILSSCTTSKPLTSTILPSEVTDLNILEPFSYITMIKKGNRGELDDSLSASSKNLIIKVLEDFSGRIPITGTIILQDSSVRSNLENEYESLITTADRNRIISNLKITPTIDKILETNNVRFGLITVATGLTRVKGNYGKQVAKGVGLAILTLGMYTETPVKSYSTVYAMIVDSKDNNVAFFRSSYLQDKEPLDEAVLKNQFERIFKGYFLQK